MLKFVEDWVKNDCTNNCSVDENIVNGVMGEKGLRDHLVHFFYNYVICVGDKDVTTAALANGGTMFQIAEPSDAALAAVLYVDNYDGWCTALKNRDNGSSSADPKNKTRWPKVRGKVKFKDRVSAEARMFYGNCLTFFNAIYENDDLLDILDEEGKDWWKDNRRVSVRKVKSSAPKFSVQKSAPVIPKLMKKRKMGNRKVSREEDGVERKRVSLSPGAMPPPLPGADGDIQQGDLGSVFSDGGTGSSEDDEDHNESKSSEDDEDPNESKAAV